MKSLKGFLLFVLYLCTANSQRNVVIQGEQRRECIPPKGFDSCVTRMDIERNSNSESTAYHLSDTPEEVNVAKAWDSTKNRNAYVGNVGESVTLSLTAKDESVFEVQKLCVATQFASKVIITAFFKFEQHPDPFTFTLYSKTVETNSSELTEVCALKANMTSAELRFIHDSTFANEGILIKKLSVKACQQTADIPIEDLQDDDRFVQANKTKKRCHSGIRFRDNPFPFIIEDNDPDRDTQDAFHKEGVYTGPDGEDVTFDISAKDTGDFEWWKVCATARNVRAAEFQLFADTVTYTKEKPTCNHTGWTQLCFAPWGRDIVVNKGKMTFLRHPDADGGVEIRNFFVIGCRDHWLNTFELFTNPGDYRILTVKTVRNEKITMFGTKDNTGGMVRSEGYHFTDNTGNHGDNTRFFLGDDLLLSKILTDRDTMNFNWNVKAKTVQINVITQNGRFQTQMVIDLKDNIVLPSRKKRAGGKKNKKGNDKTIKLKIKVNECSKPASDVIVYTRVMTKGLDVELFARKSGPEGEFELLLPKVKASKKAQKKICKKLTKVKSKECKIHRFLNRQRYRFICKQVRQILEQIPDPSASRKVEKARIHEACDATFYSMNAICRAVTESPKSGEPKHFDGKCKSGVNFTIDDLYLKLREKLTVQYIVKNDNSRPSTSVPREIDLNRPEDVDISIEREDGIFAKINSVPSNNRRDYKVKVKYTCARPKSSIKIIFPGKKPGVVMRKTCKLNDCACCELDVRRSNISTTLIDAPADHHKISYVDSDGNELHVADFYNVA